MISKLIAIKNQGIDVEINNGYKVLYLGASHGITPKLVAEIVGKEGFVFCVEMSIDVMRELLDVCEQNENMAPLLYDAYKVQDYKDKVSQVDFIYQDLAQRNQVEIFNLNVETFLKSGGKFILIIKSKSMNSVKSKNEIIEDVKNKLKGYKIKKIVDLEKTHKGHFAIIGEK